MQCLAVTVQMLFGCCGTVCQIAERGTVHVRGGTCPSLFFSHSEGAEDSGSAKLKIQFTNKKSPANSS